MVFGPVLALHSDLLPEVIMSILPVCSTHEKDQDIVEIRIVYLDGDVAVQAPVSL